MALHARYFAVALAFLPLAGSSALAADTPTQQRAPAASQPAPGAPTTARTSQPLLSQRCEDLDKKFKALDKRNLSNVVVAEATAAKGEQLCPTNPQRGIEMIEAAYRDLGLQPPR